MVVKLLIGGKVVALGTGNFRFSIFREGFNLSTLNFPIISVYLQNMYKLKLNSRF